MKRNGNTSSHLIRIQNQYLLYRQPWFSGGCGRAGLIVGLDLGTLLFQHKWFWDHNLGTILATDSHLRGYFWLYCSVCCSVGSLVSWEPKYWFLCISDDLVTSETAFSLKNSQMVTVVETWLRCPTDEPRTEAGRTTTKKNRLSPSPYPLSFWHVCRNFHYTSKMIGKSSAESDVHTRPEEISQVSETHYNIQSRS